MTYWSLWIFLCYSKLILGVTTWDQNRDSEWSNMQVTPTMSELNTNRSLQIHSELSLFSKIHSLKSGHIHSLVQFREYYLYNIVYSHLIQNNSILCWPPCQPNYKNPYMSPPPPHVFGSRIHVYARFCLRYPIKTECSHEIIMKW